MKTMLKVRTGPFTVPPDALLRRLPEPSGLSRVNEDGHLAGPLELIVEEAATDDQSDPPNKAGGPTRSASAKTATGRGPPDPRGSRVMNRMQNSGTGPFFVLTLLLLFCFCFNQIVPNQGLPILAAATKVAP
jgi:hypothetical protein